MSIDRAHYPPSTALLFSLDTVHDVNLQGVHVRSIVLTLRALVFRLHLRGIAIWLWYPGAWHYCYHKGEKNRTVRHKKSIVQQQDSIRCRTALQWARDSTDSYWKYNSIAHDTLLNRSAFKKVHKYDIVNHKPVRIYFLLITLINYFFYLLTRKWRCQVFIHFLCTCMTLVTAKATSNSFYVAVVQL